MDSVLRPLTTVPASDSIKESEPLANCEYEDCGLVGERHDFGEYTRMLCSGQAHLVADPCHSSRMRDLRQSTYRCVTRLLTGLVYGKLEEAEQILRVA